MVRIELTEEIQRDPGRFLKHLDTTRFSSDGELIEELQRALPEFRITKKLSADWSKSKQRVIDRSKALFETQEAQKIVAENISTEIRGSTDIDEIREIETKKEEIVIITQKAIITRRANIRIRDLGLQRELFVDPTLIGDRRTWSSVQKFYDLTDTELERFKEENPNIQLR